MRLKDKIALITGGTSGIGEATVRLFAAEGAEVAFTGRRRERGMKLVAEVMANGGQACYIVADHTKPEDCQRAVDETLAAFGRIDILFNNAGIVVGGTAEQTTEADWAETLLLNVTGVWRMCKIVIPLMRPPKGGGGVIVNNASDWGLVAGRNSVAYCTSKGAVVQMTRAMAWITRVRACESTRCALATRLWNAGLQRAIIATPAATSRTCSKTWGRSCRWAAWAAPTKSPKPCCSWPRMTPAL